MITTAFVGDPPYYKMKDLAGEKTRERFYEKEFQLVRKDNDVYEIESIFKKGKRGRKQQCLVRWLGYPHKFDSGIAERNLLNCG